MHLVAKPIAVPSLRAIVQKTNGCFQVHPRRLSTAEIRVQSRHSGWDHALLHRTTCSLCHIGFSLGNCFSDGILRRACSSASMYHGRPQIALASGGCGNLLIPFPFALLDRAFALGSRSLGPFLLKPFPPLRAGSDNREALRHQGTGKPHVDSRGRECRGSGLLGCHGGLP